MQEYLLDACSPQHRPKASKKDCIKVPVAVCGCCGHQAQVAEERTKGCVDALICSCSKHLLSRGCRHGGCWGLFPCQPALPCCCWQLLLSCRLGSIQGRSCCLIAAAGRAGTIHPADGRASVEVCKALLGCARPSQQPACCCSQLLGKEVGHLL